MLISVGKTGLMSRTKIKVQSWGLDYHSFSFKGFIGLKSNRGRLNIKMLSYQYRDYNVK